MIKKIKVNTAEYDQAVALRIDLFFSDFENPESMINDKHESHATHVAYLRDDQVIGTGRLHLTDDRAVISQMAIDPSYQRQGIGSAILMDLINRSQNNNMSEIRLSARITALSFYENHDFVATGDHYPSQKTGVIHQEMILKL